MKKEPNYSDPTMILPVPPPDPCKIHAEPEVGIEIACHSCAASLRWNKNYEDVVDDILLRSNVHKCNKGK